MTIGSAQLKKYIEMMAQRRASDLFITADVPPSLKIDGKIQAVSEKALSSEEARKAIYSMMTGEQRQEFEDEKECNFAISSDELGRFRANVFQQQGQVGMVLRKIETIIPSVEHLGLPPLLNDLAMTKRGLILFVGTTGSGKSTSLAAMVGHRNRKGSGHILCIEDPIEFVHKPANCIITQREVGIDTESYSVALKNALRQTPDVVLIGEIRDRETMQQAMAFTETGHLCLTTLHASHAVHALERIINLFPKDLRHQVLMDLSLNLKAIIAQSLIPRRDQPGRLPVVETLVNTPLISDLINKGKLHEINSVMKKSAKYGMKTFDQGLYELYADGHISEKDALHYANSANEVRLMIKLGTRQNNNSLAVALDGVTLLDSDSE